MKYGKSLNNRRKFLRNSGILGVGMPFAVSSCHQTKKTNNNPGSVDYTALDHAGQKAVIDKSKFRDPLILETIDLLKYKDNFICRIRTENGAEGISVSNNMQMATLYPVFLRRIKPFFLGKDVRKIESLLEEVYVFESNYKLQSLAIWVPLATLEFAILDLLGKISGESIGEVLGGVRQTEIAVYRANNHRGESAEKSLEKIMRTVEESQAKAIKFKIGGRMSREEYPKGRSEKLIPMVREAFGSDMTIYTDSNGSYDIKEAIRIGKICEENQLDFYEEPVPFDWYEETRTVTKSLDIPVAGGEQEGSMHNFRWLIGNDALDIVQPDVFYFGGMIRSMRVARMAEVKDKTCVPHISGSGLGYLYMLLFVSALKNPGPYHEFKGLNKEIPFNCPTSELRSKNGKVKVPTGPGTGIEIDPSFIAKHRVLEA